MPLALAAPAKAEDFPLKGLGLEYSVENYRDGHDMDNYAIYASLGTPWNWQLSDNFRLDTEIQSTAGDYKVNEDDFPYLSLGVNFRLRYSDFPLHVQFGTAPTYLFDDESETFDAGGNLHMTSHFGIISSPLAWLDLGLTYQHTSNAGTNKSNPGIDILSLDLSYRF
jgi:hypothetical protein